MSLLIKASPVLAIIVVVVIVLIWWFVHRKKATDLHALGGTFCAGPSNIGLYDVPYYYPNYEARSVLSWDKGHKCAAYCGIGDCAVWCR